MKIDDYLDAHPVFTVKELRSAYAGELSEGAAFQRLRTAVKAKRAKSVVKGVYASVPERARYETFQPDGFSLMAAFRKDAVFCGHSALDLLGVGHSIWRAITAFSCERRINQDVQGYIFRTFAPPELSDPQLGLQTTERLGNTLTHTGPERTLVEGFLWQDRVGEIEEFVNSAEWLENLDFDLVEQFLKEFGRKKLYASVGWFLSRNAEFLGADESLLARLEKHIPSSPQYLASRRHDPLLVKRWNLIVPQWLERGEFV